MKMLTYQEFKKCQTFSTFAERQGISREDFPRGWNEIFGDVEDRPSTDKEQYELYKNWYNDNCTKLSQYLKQ